MREIDIKNCEQAKSGDCCYCKNMAYKKLEQLLKDTENSIDDFISDISTCGLYYDERRPDTLEEVESCIEALSEEYTKFKQKLEKIYDIVKQETDTRMLFADEKSYCDFCNILQIIEGKNNVQPQLQTNNRV